MSSNNTSQNNDGDHIIVNQRVTPPLRPRKDQPTGFHGNKPSLFLRSVNHDYLYYPVEWTDRKTGKLYKKGYYDEDGKYYESVVIQKDKHYETTVACSFCGTEIRLSWEEGSLPSCPNCGAALHDTFDKALYEDEIKDITEKIRIPAPDPSPKIRPRTTYAKDQEPIFKETETTFPRIERAKPALGIILPLTALSVFFIVIMAIDASEKKAPSGFMEYKNDYEYYSSIIESDTQETSLPDYYTKFYTPDDLKESVFVRKIGRMCYLDEHKQYYDEESGCHFWFDPDQDPPCVVYRFDAISDEFGSFGLMKYDYEEKRWSIQVSFNNWIHLPDKYDESTLWHLPRPNDGKYSGKDSIYVSAIGRTCNYIEAEQNYYDPETKCHFYYNDLFGNTFWVYWFEDFREQEGIGWLRYDPDKDEWYTANINRWYPLKNAYDFSKYCWHME